MTLTASRTCSHCRLPIAGTPVTLSAAEMPLTFCCHGCAIAFQVLGLSGADLEGRLEALVGPVVAPPPDGSLVESRFEVRGLTCAACGPIIEQVLRRVGGVAAARVNVFAGTLTVTHAEESALPARIRDCLAEYGYRVRPLDKKRSLALLQDEADWGLARLGLAFFFSMNIMMLQLALYADWLSGMGTAAPPTLMIILFVLATAMMISIGGPVLRVAAVNAYHGLATMETLISLGVLATYGTSVYETFWGHGQVYYDTAGMILFFVTLGKYLEASARCRANDVLSTLAALTAGEACRQREPSGPEERVPVETVVAGDRLVVRPGERVPVDSLVEEGASSLDESALTGESLPIVRGPGDWVLAGTMNMDGRLILRAARVGEETVLSQMVALVERAQGSQAPIQRLVDRVSAFFVPVVLALAAATMAWWVWGVHAPWQVAASTAVAVLVVACPCALGIATPLAISLAIGHAAKEGLLIKSGESLERARALTTVLLDKTGTLTLGTLAVAQCHPAPGISADRLLRAAAAVEQGSEHLVAGAIVEAAHQQALACPPVSECKAFPGRGAAGVVEGRRVLIGRGPWLAEDGVLLPPLLAAAAAEAEGRGRTVVWVVCRDPDEVLGWIALGDRIRSSAAAAVSDLKALGITVAMVTGDNAGAARAVAAQAGIEEVEAGMLPPQKVGAVEARQQRGAVVALVGDGINDAPALLQADVGIALSDGTDLAVEAAGVIIVGGDLNRVPQLVRLARRTYATIVTNLAWAFLYNVVGLGFAAAGKLSPIMAAAAMVASSVSVILNSYRAAPK